MWNDFESKEFIFEERKALIVYPKGEPNGRMLLKTEYLDAFPSFDIEMLKRGYHLIFIYHRSRWANDEENDILAAFVRHCAAELSCSPRCVIEGMSCGGLQGARLSEEYPELCGVLYLDAPVLNLLSMVGFGECSDDLVASSKREICASFNIATSELVNLRKSPIDNMKPLIDNDIPIIMLYGNADPVVLYAENGRVLERYYREHNGRLKVIAKSMCKHHPHGLDDHTPIFDFIEKNYPAK